MTDKAGPVHLAGAELGEVRHVCAFFNGLDEEYQTLMSYVTEGFAHGDRAFHIVDPAIRGEHLERLKAAGVDVAGTEQRGQLEVRVWEQAYLRGGRFDQDAMLALIQEVLDAGHARGFPLTRLLAQMEWALEDRPGVDDLVEYETRLNYILPRYKDPVVWTYDLAKFGAGVVMDILRTHPMVIVGGVLQVNPFFVPPDEFLRELRARRDAGA